jgi:hypothetical protein
MKDVATDAASPKEGQSALYASPWRAGFAILFLLACGFALAALPVYLLILSSTIGVTLAGLLVGTLLLALAGVALWPALVLLRAVIQARPLITTDGLMVRKMRMGWSTCDIAWSDVGSVSLRGIWIILVDGRMAQSRFYQIMFGARGIWIPALLIHGGGAAAMQFIETYRPDLIEPLIHKVISGGR